MVYFIIVLFFCFVNSSCSTIAKDYKYLPNSEHADENGMVLVRKLEMNKAGAVKSLPDGEMSLDTREPNLWNKYVTPVLQGATSTAKESAGVL